MTLRLLAAAALAAGFSVLSASPAAAWGCQARDRYSSIFGYSTRYPSQTGAYNRALNECRARGGRRCVITGCSPYR